MKEQASWHRGSEPARPRARLTSNAHEALVAEEGRCASPAKRVDLIIHHEPSALAPLTATAALLVAFALALGSFA